METKEERSDTTIGIEKTTLAEFRKQKVKFQFYIGEQISDDYFLNKLLKSFKRYELTFEIKEKIEA